MRTCVVCSTKSAKHDMMRIVATSEGGVVLDPTGKIQGRGAYVCSRDVGLDDGLKRKRVSYVLRSPITDNSWNEIERSVESLAGSSALPDDRG